MESSRGAVGLLAGDGRLPEVLAEAVQAQGRRLICVQVVGHSPALAEGADVFLTLTPGEWSRLFTLWEEEQVTEVLIAGRFSRAELPEHLRLGDPLAQSALERAPDRRDQAFLGMFADLLARRGIKVVEQTAYARHLMPQPGLIAGAALLEEEERDVSLGMTVARSLAAQDVGQTVVLKGGVILAVEAAEGTDATIRRGAAMAEGVVVVKASRPQQDPRFDLPAIGPDTITVMAETGAGVLAVEAHRTVVLDLPVLVDRATSAGISVVAVPAVPIAQPAPAFPPMAPTPPLP